MTRAEYEKIESSGDYLVTAGSLTDQRERTLVYGYTCSRETFHAYLKDGEIKVIVYKHALPLKRSNVREIKVSGNESYLPDKRLYPEGCDYEFCERLKQAGLRLLFTSYCEACHEGPKAFYGHILEDFKE